MDAEAEAEGVRAMKDEEGDELVEDGRACMCEELCMGR